MQSGEFAQILHSNGCHWVAGTRLESQEQEIEVYNRLYEDKRVFGRDCIQL